MCTKFWGRHCQSGPIRAQWRLKCSTVDCGSSVNRVSRSPIVESLGHHRPDFIVEETVVLEIKSVARFESVFYSQVVTYLKVSGLPVGLLLNFNVSAMSHGIKRFINGDDASLIEHNSSRLRPTKFRVSVSPCLVCLTS